MGDAKQKQSELRLHGHKDPAATATPLSHFMIFIETEVFITERHRNLVEKKW